MDTNNGERQVIDWNALIPVIYQGNVDKGFWEAKNGVVRSLAECKTLMHSEVSEACEWYRETDREPGYEFVPHRLDPHVNSDFPEYMIQHAPPEVWQTWKPTGIPSELADVCIRVCDAMGHWGWKYRKCSPCGDPYIWDDGFLGDLSQIHSLISGVGEDGDWCSFVLTATESIAAHYDIDLAAAIEAKMSYNATRAYKHGKRA